MLFVAIIFFEIEENLNFVSELHESVNSEKFTRDLLTTVTTQRFRGNEWLENSREKSWILKISKL